MKNSKEQEHYGGFNNRGWIRDKKDGGEIRKVRRTRISEEVKEAIYQDMASGNYRTWEVADKYGVSEDTVLRLTRDLPRAKKGGIRLISRNEEKEIVRMADEGYTVREIASAVHCGYGVVRNVMRKNCGTEERKEKVSECRGYKERKTREEKEPKYRRLLVMVNGVLVLPGVRPAQQIIFVRDDGTYDKDAQEMYETLWDMKEEALQEIEGRNRNVWRKKGERW